MLSLLQRWAGEPRPTLVLLLELSPEVARARRAQSSDRIEDRGIEFQREVARGYARYATLVPGVARIDAARSAEVVAQDVWWEVSNALR